MTNNLEISNILLNITVLYFIIMLNLEEVSYDLSKEVNTNFSSYLNMMKINNKDILVLSPINHYYYNFNELGNVKILVQTKEFNRIHNINKFLSDVSKVLSNKSTFIGCFEDNKIRKTVTHIDKILFYLLNLSEIGDRKYLSRKFMLNLFVKYGFKVVDITEIGRYTYFCIKK